MLRVKNSPFFGKISEGENVTEKKRNIFEENNELLREILQEMREQTDIQYAMMQEFERLSDILVDTIITVMRDGIKWRSK